MTHSLPKFVFLLSMLVICGLPVAAQVTTVGSITGSVKDPNGAVVPNASVTVKNSATGLVRTTTTSDEGIFTVPQLPTGVYHVTIETKSGFKKSEVTGVKVKFEGVDTIFARKIKRGEDEFLFRDGDGKPLW